MEIIQKLVKNYSQRNNQRILAVVIHVGEGNRNQIYSTFQNEQKSSHYCVNNDGSVWQFVQEKDCAWHAGQATNPYSKLVKNHPKLNPNLYTIGIENEGFGSDSISALQYQVNARLVKEICERWDIPMDDDHIIPHHSIRSDKSCPGRISTGKIVEIANGMKLAEQVIVEKQISLFEQILEMLKNFIKRSP